MKITKNIHYIKNNMNIPYNRHNMKYIEFINRVYNEILCHLEVLVNSIKDEFYRSQLHISLNNINIKKIFNIQLMATII